MGETLRLDEQEALRRYREKRDAAALKEIERQKALEGYLFWCSEGCGFVGEFHRCEQWTSITYIPPEAVEAIRKDRSELRALAVQWALKGIRSVAPGLDFDRLRAVWEKEAEKELSDG